MDHYISFVSEDELDKEDAAILFKVVNKYAPVASIIAVNDDGEEYDESVMTMTSRDGKCEYKIPLTQSVTADIGERISRELAKKIDVDFEVEASI